MSVLEIKNLQVSVVTDAGNKEILKGILFPWTSDRWPKSYDCILLF